MPLDDILIDRATICLLSQQPHPKSDFWGGISDFSMQVYIWTCIVYIKIWNDRP